MDIEISTLTVDEIDAVDRLMKQNSATLGFLPRAALEEYISKGNVLGAWRERGEFTGYLLYGANRSSFRIAHLCVSEGSRGYGIARALVEELKQKATTQKTVTLHCRRDFPAHGLWPNLGFIPLGERPGRSVAGHLLTYWCLTVDHDDQLSLFQAESSFDTLNVVIDAQVFFDIIGSGRNQEDVSKSLMADFLVESIDLRVTDELFVEIDRSDNPVQRELARESAHQFGPVRHDIELSTAIESNLKTFLPNDSLRALSDIRQLAKTAAAGVKYFVTRDRRLLREAQRIKDMTDRQVLSPSELIVRVHELSDAQAYIPDRVSGVGFEWRRLRSTELNNLPYETFLVQGEGKGEFKGRLERYLAEPSRFGCELLWSGDEAIAMRVLERNDDDSSITIHVARGSNSGQRSLIEQFLVSDIVVRAAKDGLEKIEFTDAGALPRLKPDLKEMSFIESDGRFVRFCFSRNLQREEVLARISEIAPECCSQFHSMSDSDLQQCCSPVSLSSEEDCFLIPIRPGYALSLVDQRQAANDLFGGDTNVLLKWDNAYYRKKTHHRMLTPPGRLLWYVSGTQRRVVAISQLDDVEVGTPGDLFRKYRGLGILDWNQIYEMCDGDTHTDIMALKFSHTFPLRQPISLEELRNIYEEDGINLVLQSPSKVHPTTFKKLFRHGFN